MNEIYKKYLKTNEEVELDAKDTSSYFKTIGRSIVILNMRMSNFKDKFEDYSKLIQEISKDPNVKGFLSSKTYVLDGIGLETWIDFLVDENFNESKYKNRIKNLQVTISDKHYARKLKEDERDAHFYLKIIV